MHCIIKCKGGLRCITRAWRLYSGVFSAGSLKGWEVQLHVSLTGKDLMHIPQHTNERAVILFHLFNDMTDNTDHYDDWHLLPQILYGSCRCSLVWGLYLSRRLYFKQTTFILPTLSWGTHSDTAYICCLTCWRFVNLKILISQKLPHLLLAWFNMLSDQNCSEQCMHKH